MNTQELQGVMESFDVFANALLSHGYKDYMRDYELVVENIVNPEPLGTYAYLFKYGVEAHITTSLPDEGYRMSMDDSLIDFEAGKGLPGYLWGVRWSDLYPGWTLNLASAKAVEWTRRLGIQFHDILIETNVYKITLIFGELVVEQIAERTGSRNT